MGFGLFLGGVLTGALLVAYLVFRWFWRKDGMFVRGVIDGFMQSNAKLRPWMSKGGLRCPECGHEVIYHDTDEEEARS